MSTLRKIRHAGRLRQHWADVADGVPAVRIAPVVVEGAWADQVRTHVSLTRQARIKVARRKERRVKQTLRSL
jgi:hypothetical protein